MRRDSKRGPIRRVALLGVGLLVSFGVVALCAITQNATVTGLVYDEKTGSPVAGATVVLLSANTSFKQQKTTEADGSFTFNYVPPSDDYILQAAKKGYEPLLRDALLDVKVADYMVVPHPVVLTPLKELNK